MATHESLVSVREDLLEKLDFYQPTIQEKLDKKRYAAAKALFYYHSTISNQLDNYNHTLEETLHRIVREGNEINSNIQPGAYKVIFGSLSIKNHPVKNDGQEVILFPKEAEQTGKNYCVEIYVSVEIIVGEKTRKFNKIHFVDFPVMVGSKWCSLSTIPRSEYPSVGEDPLEEGGYFIVGGSRKFITQQERSSFNGIYVFGARKKSPAYEFHAEIRNSATSGSRTSNVIVGYHVDRFYVNIGDYPANLPIGIVFKSLGVVSEDDILNIITPEKDYKFIELLTPSLEDTFGCKDQLTAQTHVREIVFKESFAYNTKISSEENKKNKIKFNNETVEKVNDLFQKEFFSRQGVTLGLLIKKAMYLGVAINRLLSTKLGKRELMDRDHFGSKCLDGSGDSLANKLYNGFTQIKSTCMRSCDEQLLKNNTPNPLNYLKTETITTTIINCLKTGNWSDPRRVGKEKTGVSNQFEINNYQGANASLCETSASISTEGTLSKARHGHGSHDGIICPWQTVEGKNVGLKKGLSVGAKITIGENPQEIISVMNNLDYTEFGLFFIQEDFCLDDLNFVDSMDLDIDEEDGDFKPSIFDTKIIVNGNWIGMVRYTVKFLTHMRAMRRKREIHQDISFAYYPEDNEIIISTEIGRPTNPLFLVNKNGKVKVTMEHLEALENEQKFYELKQKISENKNSKLSQSLYILYEELKQKPRMDWNDLINNGIVEFLDSREKENTLIATHIEDIIPGKTTHVLVHPCLNIGYAASTVPLPDHNQAPRNAYQSAHMKQFISWPGLNVFEYDLNGTSSHVLPYAQKPLVANQVARDRLNVDKRPTGQNVVISLQPNLGFNQEDSQIVNKAAVDRGLFLTIHYSKYYAVIDTSKRIVLEIPTNNNQATRREGWLDHIDEQGIPIVGSRIKKGDTVIPLVRINKVYDEGGKMNVKKEDISILFKSDETGQIDKVQVGLTEENYMYIRVRVISVRKPETGDKTSSRAGQKGTIGLVRSPEDMPFTEEGIIPDMNITPSCIPSRMTIGHMIESLMGKAIACKIDPELRKKPLIVRVKRKDGTRQFRKVNQLTTEEMMDATPYNRQFSLDYFTQALEQAGYHPSGKDVMYDGMTGQKLTFPIYIGIVHYQRLKHMVEDKWHARMSGSRTRLFRQASEGRNKAGGLRFGEINRSQCVCKYVLVYVVVGNTSKLRGRLVFACQYCLISNKGI